jgi:signal transduction histidine kinase
MRVKQILIKLVNNALKFTFRGEVIVLVTADPQKEKKWQIKFSVRDSGIGIPTDKISLLFKSFSQVDASTTTGWYLWVYKCL